jgi:hypothetical protein
MTRYIVLLVVLASVSGCQGQGQWPSVNLLAPYGPTRIPPPSTGTYGQPDTYYQPSPQPAAPQTQPSVSTSPVSRGRPGQPTLAAVETRTHAEAAQPEEEAARKPSGFRSTSPSDTSRVRLASAERTYDAEAPLRIVEPRAERSADAIELRGMHVNDATKPAEPGRFVAPARMADISQLPPATRSVSTPAETRLAPKSFPKPKAQPTGSSSGEERTTTGGWRVREPSRPALRVAGR